MLRIEGIIGYRARAIVPHEEIAVRRVYDRQNSTVRQVRFGKLIKSSSKSPR